MIVEQWLAAEFEGGRHQDRINIIARIEDAEKKIKGRKDGRNNLGGF